MAKEWRVATKIEVGEVEPCYTGVYLTLDPDRFTIMEDGRALVIVGHDDVRAINKAWNAGKRAWKRLEAIRANG